MVTADHTGTNCRPLAYTAIRCSRRVGIYKQAFPAAKSTYTADPVVKTVVAERFHPASFPVLDHRFAALASQLAQLGKKTYAFAVAIAIAPKRPHYRHFAIGSDIRSTEQAGKWSARRWPATKYGACREWCTGSLSTIR